MTVCGRNCTFGGASAGVARFDVRDVAVRVGVATCDEQLSGVSRCLVRALNSCARFAYCDPQRTVVCDGAVNSSAVCGGSVSKFTEGIFASDTSELDNMKSSLLPLCDSRRHAVIVSSASVWCGHCVKERERMGRGKVAWLPLVLQAEQSRAVFRELLKLFCGRSGLIAAGVVSGLIAGGCDSVVGQTSSAIVEDTQVHFEDSAVVGRAQDASAARDVADWIQARMNEPVPARIDPFGHVADIRLRLAVNNLGTGRIGQAEGETLGFDFQPLPAWRGMVNAAHVRLTCGAQSELSQPRDGEFAQGSVITMLDCTARILASNHANHRAGDVVRVGFMVRKRDYLDQLRVGRDWQIPANTLRMLSDADSLEGVMAFVRFDESRFVVWRFARAANGVLVDSLGQSSGGNRVEL